MPHLSIPITPAGPLLDIVISVSQPRADALRNASLPIPPPVKIRGLVDTGASCSCIDPTILAQLNLTPTGIGSFNTASSGSQSTSASLYDINLTGASPICAVAWYNKRGGVRSFYAGI